MIEHFIFQVIPILREYLKDGILEIVDDSILTEHSINEIVLKSNYDLRINMIADNIMFILKKFDDKNNLGDNINNEYIKKFILDLCDKLNY